MAAVTQTPALQLSWTGSEAVAWHPGQRGSAAADLPHEVARLTRLAALGRSLTVVPMLLPSGRANVLCQRVEPSTLTSLGQLDVLRVDVSASVAWFGDVLAHAQALVRRGRVLPRLTELDGAWWQATWVALPTDLAAATPVLDKSMPPVVGAAGPVDSAQVLAVMVDQVGRQALATHGWHAALTDTRSVTSRAVRAITRALTVYDGRFPVAPELVDAVRHVAGEFDVMARRADGEPILRARLRLDTPTVDDPDEWPLRLELVDADDRGRWCTMEDLVAGAPTARALASEERFMPLLEECLRGAADHIAVAVPEIAPWLAERATTTDIDGAAAILEAVTALDAVGIELVAPERLVRRRPSARGTVQPREVSGSGRFSATALVSWELVLDDTPVAADVLRRAAEEGANLIQVGGRWVQVDRTEARHALARLQEHRNEHAEVGPLELLRLAAELERALADAPIEPGPPPPPMLRATGWAAELLRGLPDVALAEADVPPTFAATLRPYQRRGLAWLQFLRQLRLGGCLADDMGLGKTPTTLAHLAGLPGPHLVVCPLSVVRNWESESARFVPFMRVMVHHGTGRAGSERFADDVAQHDLVITTYQVATRDIDVLGETVWSTVVLDEAQAVKNPDTHAAKAMRRLPAEQHLALTGTPVENRLGELWSIFHIVVPGLLGTASEFRRRFAGPIERERSQEAAAALRQLTAPFLLRRTKADRSLVPDLPDKVEQIAWAPLTREQAHMYEAVVEQLLVDAQQATGMRRRGLVLAALTRLKQICNHPAHALGDGSRLVGRSGKLHRFDELVTDLLEAEEHALVFTQFRAMGLLLQAHLRERFGLTVPFLHGGVARANRDRMVSAFQAGTSTAPLLLVSLKAGGTGLNLTAASRVVHYDRWWNPAVEDQATDRAWRIGQQRSVFVHKLVCEGTVEERIDGLISDKRALADAVVGTTGETWLSELSTDELRALVVLDHTKVRGG